ncbi:hypothetical protein [Nocardia cyriacigeorgica]|uniref:hypothetical protein n=1 Tax=Nocardia cyriacigeorgica TaxID=135487 RepID=UPI00138ABD5C|nr:hypothetical protein [Nocardia cyriacigeorgica]
MVERGHDSALFVQCVVYACGTEVVSSADFVDRSACSQLQQNLPLPAARFDSGGVCDIGEGGVVGGGDRPLGDRPIEAEVVDEIAGGVSVAGEDRGEWLCPGSHVAAGVLEAGGGARAGAAVIDHTLEHTGHGVDAKHRVLGGRSCILVLPRAGEDIGGVAFGRVDTEHDGAVVAVDPAESDSVVAGVVDLLEGLGSSRAVSGANVVQKVVDLGFRGSAELPGARDAGKDYVGHVTTPPTVTAAPDTLSTAGLPSAYRATGPPSGTDTRSAIALGPRPPVMFLHPGRAADRRAP